MAYEELSRGFKKTANLFQQAASQARREELQEQRMSDIDDQIYAQDLMEDLSQRLEVTVNEAIAFGAEFDGDMLFSVKDNLATRAPRMEFKEKLNKIKNPQLREQYAQRIDFAYASTDRALAETARAALPMRIHQSQLEAVQNSIGFLEDNPNGLAGALSQITSQMSRFGNDIMFTDDVTDPNNPNQFTAARPWAGSGDFANRESSEIAFVKQAVSTAVGALLEKEEFSAANDLLVQNKDVIIDKMGSGDYMQLRASIVQQKGAARRFHQEMDAKRYAGAVDQATAATGNGSVSLGNFIQQNPDDWNLLGPQQRSSLYSKADTVDSWNREIEFFSKYNKTLHMEADQREHFEKNFSGSTEQVFGRAMEQVATSATDIESFSAGRVEAGMEALDHLESMNVATPQRDWEFLANMVADGNIEFGSREEMKSFVDRLLAVRARDEFLLQNAGNETLNRRLSLISDGYDQAEVESLLGEGATVSEDEKKFNLQSLAENFKPKTSESGFQSYESDVFLRRVIDPAVSASMLGSEMLGEFTKEYFETIFDISKGLGLASDPHFSIPESLRSAHRARAISLVNAGIDPISAQTMAAENLFKPGGDFTLSTEGDVPRVIQNAAWPVEQTNEETMKGLVLNLLSGISPEIEQELFEDGWIFDATPEEAWSKIEVTQTPFPSDDPEMVSLRVTRRGQSLLDGGTWLHTDIEIPKSRFINDETGKPYGSWAELRENEDIPVHPRMLDTRMTAYDEKRIEDEMTERVIARIQQVYEEGPGEFPTTPGLVARWQLAGRPDPGPKPTRLSDEEREVIARNLSDSMDTGDLAGQVLFKEALEQQAAFELEKKQKAWSRATKLITEPGSSLAQRQMMWYTKQRLVDTWGRIKNAEGFEAPIAFPAKDSSTFEDDLIDWALQQELEESGGWERYYGSDIDQAKRLIRWEDAYRYSTGLRMVEE